MSAEQGFAPSLWERHEDNSETTPKYCPHCGGQLAHPDDLRDNDDIKAVGYASAYREHREAHYGWGTDPADIHRDGDPYLADYYDDGEDGETHQSTLDLDEEVAGIYDVDIHYEAVVRARVVAADKGHAKEKAEDLRLMGDADLCGDVPEAHLTHKVHTDTTERTRVTRGDVKDSSDVDEDEDGGINYAERLEGWPW